MKIEDDRLIDGKKGIEVPVRQSVWMFSIRLQFEKINYIDVTNLYIGEFFPQEHNCRQRFLRRNISCRSHHNVRLAALVVAGPFPNADSLGAVLDGGIHVHELEMELFVANNNVDVVFAAQTVVGHREQAIDVRREINARYAGALVHHQVRKPGS